MTGRSCLLYLSLRPLARGWRAGMVSDGGGHHVHGPTLSGNPFVRVTVNRFLRSPDHTIQRDNKLFIMTSRGDRLIIYIILPTPYSNYNRNRRGFKSDNTIIMQRTPSTGAVSHAFNVYGDMSCYELR